MRVRWPLPDRPGAGVSCLRLQVTSLGVTAAAMLGVAAAPCAGDIIITVTAGPGLNIAIPDNGYDGTLASMASVDLLVSPPPGVTITGVRVLLSLSHTWIGDTVMKVRSPGGTVVTLMSRPGLVEGGDDGVGCCGDSSNLSAAFPVEFLTGELTSAEDMGNTLTNDQEVCRHDAICRFQPNAGAALPGTLASYNGQSPAGTWQVFVGDSEGGDTGIINQCTLTFTASQPCQADTNGDDSVNVSDLLAVINAWGACPAPCPPTCPADVEGANCQVNVSDLLLVINSWGPCP